MISFIEKKRHNWFFKSISLLIVCSLALMPTTPVMAQSQLLLPSAGSMITPTAAYYPPIINGLTLNPENPFEFQFLIDTGDDKISGEALREESDKLIKYFLTSLTTPEDQMWVNLSPYEQNRIIPEDFGRTEMGRDLLAQDYLLKQLTASLMYPESKSGKEFWTRIEQKLGNKDSKAMEDLAVNTFNKVWIVPERAMIYEHGKSVFVVDSYLKVMLENDYLALEHSTAESTDSKSIEHADQQQIIRDVIIPEIEREVNEGQTFANLRQIFNSMVLATWYKQNLKESVLGQIYVDQGKTKFVDSKDAQANQKIYEQYLEAFKVGVYDYIKEEYDPTAQKMIPRKYFSGGAAMSDKAMSSEVTALQLARFAERAPLKTVVVAGLESPGIDLAGLTTDAAMIVKELTREEEITLEVLRELKVALTPQGIANRRQGFVTPAVVRKHLAVLLKRGLVEQAKTDLGDDGYKAVDQAQVAEVVQVDNQEFIDAVIAYRTIGIYDLPVSIAKWLGLEVDEEKTSFRVRYGTEDSFVRWESYDDFIGTLEREEFFEDDGIEEIQIGFKDVGSLSIKHNNGQMEISTTLDNPDLVVAKVLTTLGLNGRVLRNVLEVLPTDAQSAMHINETANRVGVTELEALAALSTLKRRGLVDSVIKSEVNPLYYRVADAAMAAIDVADTEFPLYTTFNKKAVLIQGAGGTGGQVVRPFLESGAHVVISDVNPGQASALRAEFADAIRDRKLLVITEERLEQGGYTDNIFHPFDQYAGELIEMGIDHFDIFVPAAIGPVINPVTTAQLEDLGVKVVAGSANNLLEDIERDAEGLRKAGIVYVTDYVANGWGTRFVNGHMGQGTTYENARAHTTRYYREVYDEALAQGVSPQVIADERAQEFIDSLESAVKLDQTIAEKEAQDVSIELSELDLDDLDQEFVDQNRVNPLRLNGLVTDDGTEIAVMAYEDQIPQEIRHRWDDHYAVFRMENKRLGYTAFLSIHKLTKIVSLTEKINGQWRATGGTRIIDNYPNEEASQADSMELGREMSFKNAAQEMRIGGSKGSIFMHNGAVANTRSDRFDPETMKEKRDAVIVSYSRTIETIGRLIGGGVLTGQDVNVSEDDAKLMFANAPTSIVPYLDLENNRTPVNPTGRGIWTAISVATEIAFAGADSAQLTEAREFIDDYTTAAKKTAVEQVSDLGRHLRSMDPHIVTELQTPKDIFGQWNQLRLQGEDGVLYDASVFQVRVVNNTNKGPGKGGIRWITARDLVGDPKKSNSGDVKFKKALERLNDLNATEEEVRAFLAKYITEKTEALALGMTKKPTDGLGGAKGSILIAALTKDESGKWTLKDYDNWSDLENQAIIARGHAGALTIAKKLGVDRDIPAPDVRTNPDTMSWYADEYIRLSIAEIKARYADLGDELEAIQSDREVDGFKHTDTPFLDAVFKYWQKNEVSMPWLGVFTGKAVKHGGALGRDVATGYGVVDIMVDVLGDLNEKTVAIQGFGNVGRYTALRAAQKGATVKIISDYDIALVKESGWTKEQIQKIIDVGRLSKDLWEQGAYGFSQEELADVKAVVSSPGAATRTVLYADVDALVPAALGGDITEENEQHIQARWIFEAANGPVTTVAESNLTKRGITVVPDTLVNAGGVIVSSLETVQAVKGKPFTWEEVDEIRSRTLKRARAQAQLIRSENAGMSFRMAYDIYAVREIIKAKYRSVIQKYQGDIFQIRRELQSDKDLSTIRRRIISAGLQDDLEKAENDLLAQMKIEITELIRQERPTQSDSELDTLFDWLIGKWMQDHNRGFIDFKSILMVLQNLPPNIQAEILGYRNPANAQVHRDELVDSLEKHDQGNLNGLRDFLIQKLRANGSDAAMTTSEASEETEQRLALQERVLNFLRENPNKPFYDYEIIRRLQADFPVDGKDIEDVLDGLVESGLIDSVYSGMGFYSFVYSENESVDAAMLRIKKNEIVAGVGGALFFWAVFTLFVDFANERITEKAQRAETLRNTMTERLNLNRYEYFQNRILGMIGRLGAQQQEIVMDTVLEMAEQNATSIDDLDAAFERLKALDSFDKSNDEALDSLLNEINAIDQAMRADEQVGGIDLNPANFMIDKKDSRLRMDMRVDPAVLQGINIEGLRPVIINIAPVVNLPLLLGLTDAEDTTPYADTSDQEPYAAVENKYYLAREMNLN